MSELSDLAEVIFNTEFDSDSNVTSVVAITAWLEENLGLLNTLLNTSFQGTDPDLGLEEESIYKIIYLYNFYSKQARNVLRGIVSTTGGGNILSVADGDNKIQFVNKNEVGKTYRDLARELKSQLDQLVTKYNIYGAKPLQVGGIEASAQSSSASLSEDDTQDGEVLVSSINSLFTQLSANITDGNSPPINLDSGTDDLAD
jgi:hypothetical protein